MATDSQKITRRRFLGGIAAAGVTGAAVTLGLPVRPASAARRTSADFVTLGRSGVQVSRLGMGTGSNSGSIQRAMGKDGFDRLVRYALDHGVSFFDTADNYSGMHEMLRDALRGIDRSRYQIQTKISDGKYDNPRREIDRFRKELGVEYFDSLLIHFAHTPNWVEQAKPLIEILQDLKEQKIIRSHGVSMHGLPALSPAAGLPWVDIALVRVNHNGTHMDGPTGGWNERGERDTALRHIRAIHDAGKGVIGMKIIGNGDFTDPAERERSIRFVMGLAYVDSVIIGFKSPAEIDEAITRINDALNA